MVAGPHVVLANGAVSNTAIPGAPDFQWDEFEGYNVAAPAELARLAELAATILQPVRDAFGAPVIISRGGWLFSRFGYRRDREHANGSTADFNVAGTAPFDVWAWMGSNLSAWGELIEERDHVHVSLPGFGGDNQYLREPVEGQYVAYTPGDPYGTGAPVDFGGTGDVYELPGITASVFAFPGLTWLVVAGLGLALVRVVHNSGRGRYA